MSPIMRDEDMSPAEQEVVSLTKLVKNMDENNAKMREVYEAAGIKQVYGEMLNIDFVKLVAALGPKQSAELKTVLLSEPQNDPL